MRGACGRHETDEKYLQNFSQKTCREETACKDLGIDGRKHAN